MEKKGFIASSIALINNWLYDEDVNAEDSVKRKKVTHNQIDILRERQKQEDVERKKLLEEILL